MPAEGLTVKFQMMMTPADMAALDDYRWRHRVRSRAEAVRRLIATSLQNEKGPAGAPTPPSHDQNHTTEMDGGIDA